MRSTLLCTLAIAIAIAGTVLRAEDTASVPTADGFQCPVGPNGTGEGYYIARGYRPNGHLGDDWNGIKGGDTDFGDPVYAAAHGIVVFAKDYHVGWGNVVILRHAFYEGLSLNYVDSLYGHLNDFNVHEGQEVKRGQLIGHIGNNHGMYDAHLHFEIRKNINIGMYRGSFPRDNTNYYEPNAFLAAHLSCPRGGKTVSVPINTYAATPPPLYVAAKVETPVYSPGSAPASHLPPPGAGSIRLSRESVPEFRAPAPAPPAPPAQPPVIATAPVSIPKAPGTPGPTPKPSAIASAATKTTATPTPKPSTTASTSARAAATPSPATKGATTKTAKASPTPSSVAKGSTIASTKPAATPSPAAKATGAASAKTAAAPPATGKGATTASATTKPPAAQPAAPKAAPAKTPPAEVAESKPEPKAKPNALAADTYEPATPAPTTGGPIRRSSSGFHVDRFQDLRGMGY